MFAFLLFPSLLGMIVGIAIVVHEHREAEKAHREFCDRCGIDY